MISALFGKVGEGKSLTGSMHARELLDAGRKVYTNLHLNETRPNYFYFPTEDWEMIYKLQDGTILFDEGQLILDARNWQNTPVSFRQLLQQGRHEGLDFVVLTQDVMQIETAYRRLIQEAHVIWRLFGSRKWNFGVFMKRAVDTTGSVDRQKTHGWPSFFLATKNDFQYYNSWALRTQKDTTPIHQECKCGRIHKLNFTSIKENQARLSVDWMTKNEITKVPIQLIS